MTGSATSRELDQLVEAVRSGTDDWQFLAGRRGGSGRASAVLALVSDGGDPDIVVTRRPLTLRHHAGQVALPGGRFEEGDPDLVATALREAREEVGLDPSWVEVVGTLPVAHVPGSSSDVTTVVATWDGHGELGVVDPAEVSLVSRIPLTELADPAHRVRARHPSGRLGPAFNLPTMFIWGFTAHLIDTILTRGGWARPWLPGPTIEIPEEYLGRHSPGR